MTRGEAMGGSAPVAGAPAPGPAQDMMTVPALRPVGVRNLANALTMLRLLLVPLFVVLLVRPDASTGSRVAALLVFAVASATDRIDGDIARRRGLVTGFGTIADPIADKALTGAAFLGLSALGELAWWVTVVVLVREIGVTLLRFFVIRHGVIPASRGGKVKTLLQTLAVGLYVLPLSGWPATGRALLMAAAVAVTVVTGADYIVRAVKLRRTSARAVLKRRRAAQGVMERTAGTR